ncbi:MAG: D-alanyl-D-alanine carboxypeptidase family protein [Chloroflexota bacterium]
MAYAGPKAPRLTGRVAAYRRERPLGRLMFSAAGGITFLLGTLLLLVSLLPRAGAGVEPEVSADARSIDVTLNASTVGTRVPVVDSTPVVSAPALSARAGQQGGAAGAFAAPPSELTSPGWLQNYRATQLWSTAEADGAGQSELPQWTHVQFTGEARSGRVRVFDPGDGAKRTARPGWVSADDVGPAGPPPVEWYLGVGESERGLTGVPRRASDDWPAQISGQGAVVLDGQTGAVLFGKNARRRMAMASCTKMITAIIALERGRLDDRVTVDVDGLKMAIEMESTIMGLKVGDTLTLETLLYGLMLPSGNDAAVAIARHIAGSEAQFVDLMNAKVRELGLEDTHFKNSHGLDASGHYSTPYDQASIARYGMTNPVFARLAAAREYAGDGYQLWNTNRLLWNYPGADGVKPGFTDDAGSALVASATRDGHRIITAVIKANSAAIDSVPLLDWAFRSFRW